MGVVLVAALGFAALPQCVRSLGRVNAHAHVRRADAWGGRRRLPGVARAARWLGFTLFGGGYLALAHATLFSPKPLPTITLAEFIGSGVGDKLAGQELGTQWVDVAFADISHLHCFVGTCPGSIGVRLAGSDRWHGDAALKPVEVTASRPALLSIRWMYPAFIGLVGFWTVAMTATVRQWPAPGVWAGASFLLTCALLGLASLAALFTRGRDREVYLGAAPSGFAYLC